jgi:hypothetical protein
MKKFTIEKRPKIVLKEAKCDECEIPKEIKWE